MNQALISDQRFQQCATAVQGLLTAVQKLQQTAAILQTDPVEGSEWYQLLRQKLAPQLGQTAFLVAAALLGALLSLAFAWARPLGFLLVGGMVGVALLAFVQSFAKYRNLSVASLSIATLFLQVFAYGMGTWSGILQRLRGEKVAKGFTKNYYK